ncbi:MAG: hypothetical protein Q4F11_00455 [Eubacteriales bacterium]|nr:hypothetical protein [Eubacteriales bacterium]
MSRIKYPEQSVINQQITQILDRSGIFENKSNDNLELGLDGNFVKCEPVKEKKAVMGFKAVSGVLAVAAAILLAVAVGNYRPVQQSGLQPLNAVSEDTTIVKEAEEKFRNSDISVTYDRQASELKSLNGQYCTGIVFYTFADIKYKGISQVFSDKSVFNISNMADELYGQYYDNAESGVLINYSQQVKDANLVDDKILAVKGSTQIELNSIENPRVYNRQSAYNIDASTNQVLKFDIIFKDVNAGKEQLKQLLEKEIGNVSNASMDSEMEGFVKEAVEDGQWYLEGDYMNVIVNDYFKVVNEGVRSENFEIFSIPKSALTYLVDDYR